MHTEGSILSHDVGAVRVFTFSRESKRNALTPAMLKDLRSQLQQLRRDVEEAHNAAPRSVLLTGVGQIFCAGFDLSLCQHDDTVLRDLLVLLSACIQLLQEQPLPVVISAHGAAIAGACALLGAADCVVTTTDAKIGYPVVRLGISPAVSAPTLAQQIGVGPARVRLLDTQLVSGLQALTLGLAHFAEPDAKSCEARALALATELASKPPHAVQATRRLCQQLAQQQEAPPKLDIEGNNTSVPSSQRALEASLSLVEGEEGKRMLAAVWSK